MVCNTGFSLELLEGLLKVWIPESKDSREVDLGPAGALGSFQGPLGGSDIQAALSSAVLRHSHPDRQPRKRMQRSADSRRESQFSLRVVFFLLRKN